MNIKLTKAEAELLLSYEQDTFTGDLAEFKDLVTNTYWVLDDAPYPYWERKKMMKVLSDLAAKHDFEIEF